ncbi:MAG: undecaprenyl-diphosphate phosphatase [bacterium]
MNELSMLKAIFLGALQGATEFLPVSSSGHLVIAQGLLGVKLENGGLLAFDVCLHFGTLLAILVAFWRDIAQILANIFRRNPGDDVCAATGMSGRQARRMGLMIIVGSIPAGLLGPPLNDFFERLFSSVTAAAAMLLVTGCILWGTRFARDQRIGVSGMGFWRALLVGVAQAIAIIPGISRSGSTISGGLYLGVDRALAARFAFLLAVPAIGGASLFKLKEMQHFSHDIAVAAIAGAAVAAIVGFACIKWLLRIVKRGRFSWFAYYCWAAGLATLLYLQFGK